MLGFAMLQILLLSALILMLNQSGARNSAIGYTFFNVIMFLCMGIPVLAITVWPLIIIKSVLVYIFFRILEDKDGSGFWWPIYFFGMLIIFLSDRFLGLPIIMAYSSIPFVDTLSSLGKPADFQYSLPNLIRGLLESKSAG